MPYSCLRRWRSAAPAFTCLFLVFLVTTGIAPALAAPAASLDQIRNGDDAETTTPAVQWVSGNAGATNSHYREGHSIAYRAVMTELPTDGTVIELIVGFDVKTSDKHALDYLTHYQRLLPHFGFAHTGAETVNPLDGVVGASALVTTTPMPTPTVNVMVDPDGAGPATAKAQPVTSFNALPAAERVFTLFGGTLIDASYVTEGDLSLSQSEAQIKVRFTADSPTAVLAWGGHIGSRLDWGIIGGEANSAAGISGSSYHSDFNGWNLGNLGSQDRSLAATAVIAPPECNIGNTGPFCAGTENVHSAPSGMEAYLWSFGANSAGASFVGGATSQTVTVSAPNAGSYTLVLRVDDANAYEICETVVTVNDPAVANAGVDQTVCASAPAVTLAATLGGGATSGSWSGGAGDFAPNDSDPNAVYTPSAGEIAAGTVTLTWTTDDPAGPCGADADEMTITIDPAATADAGEDQTVCAASPDVQLAGLFGGGASSGTWSGGSGDFAPSASAVNAVYTPSPAEVAAGTVTLTFTTNDPAGPCGGTADEMTITILPAATADAGDDRTVCSVSPAVALDAASDGGATSGSWSGGAGDFAPNANDPQATYTPSAGEIAAGTVTLTWTTNDPAGPCGTAADQMTITITPDATADAGLDRTVCASAPAVVLDAAAGGGASSGAWSGGAGDFAPDASDPQATYTPSAGEIAAGTVTLTWTTDDPEGPCGAASDAMTITILPAATADAGDDAVVCSASPVVTLDGGFGGGATSGSWSGGAGDFAPNANDPQATYTPSAGEIAAGSVTLTFTTDDPAGPCGAIADQMTITINPDASADAGDDQTVCALQPSVQLAGSFGGGATSGAWSGGAGTFNPNANAGNAVYTPSAAEIAAGTVTLTFTSDDPAGPCDARSDAMTITIDPAVVVSAGPDRRICIKTGTYDVQLAGYVSGASGAVWSGGQGTFTPNASTLNAVYTPTAEEIALGLVVLTLESLDPPGPCGKSSDEMKISYSTCDEGCTPGFWQGGRGSQLWDEPNDPQWNIDGGTGTNPFTHDVLFNDYFTPHPDLVGLTMFELVDSGGTQVVARKAARSLVAAYLNSAYGMEYPWMPDELAAMWTAAVAEGQEALHDLHRLLDEANNLGCPTSKTRKLARILSPELTGPGALELYRPSPNPFQGWTRIAYAVPGPAVTRAEIAVFDLAGRRVRTIVSGLMAPGQYEARWDGLSDDGARMRSGAYFVRASVGEARRTMQVLLLD